MKKEILAIALLIGLSTSSCKKSYECSCTETQTSSETAVMTQYQPDVDTYNADQADKIPDTDKIVTSIDKTTKGKATIVCAGSEETNTHTIQDAADKDTDSDYLEAAYIETTVTKMDCTLKKK